MKKLFVLSVFTLLGVLLSANCLAADVTFKVKEVRNGDGYILVHVKDIQAKKDVGTYKYKAEENTTTVVVKGLTNNKVYQFVFTHDESDTPDMDYWKDYSSQTSDAVDYDSMNPSTSPVFQVTGNMSKTVNMRYFD